MNRSRAYELVGCQVQEGARRPGRGPPPAICPNTAGDPPEQGSVSCGQAVTQVTDLIGLHFLSDFKKDVGLVVLGNPTRQCSLKSQLTRFIFLPGDRHRS